MNKIIVYLCHKVVFLENSQEFRVAEEGVERQFLPSEIAEEERFSLPFLTLGNQVVMLTRVILKNEEVVLVDLSHQKV